MGRFQKSVIIISGIVLVIMFIFIGYALSKSSTDGVWPPISSPCPDYWLNVEGKCENTHKLGTCNIPTPTEPNAKDFDVDAYNGSGGICAKYTWAKACGITWDGITSGISNPCV
jgi:hypothetical protein